jgi:hypothetical protein
MSISTARGRLRPEVTSPVDRATTVFLFEFCRHLPSILYCYDVIRAFVIAEKGRKTISAARGRARPEVKSPFDSLTPIWYRSVLEFFDYLLPVQSYSTFRFSCKMPFENFGEEIFPSEIFSSMRPQKALPWVNPRRLRYRACKSVQWSGL